MIRSEMTPALAWAWYRYVLQRRLMEPTPERKALWFYHIEDAKRAFVQACGEVDNSIADAR
jgi:hypothetical protein